MQNIINILLGLQIGMQLIAVYFVFRIALLEITPQIYYLVALNLLLMNFIRIDFVFGIIQSPIFRFSLWTVVSFLWMFCFIKIYYLIANRYE